MQPLLVTKPVEAVGVSAPQLSLAVAVPNAASICAEVGLQPSVNVIPVAVITGAIESWVHVTILEAAMAVLPQASVAFHVLICVRMQPLLETRPVEAVGVSVPQLSVAVAVPSAASICADVGLQPRINVVPLAVITGAIES